MRNYKKSVFRSWLQEDPVYDSFMISKFINFFIKKGRKERVQNIFFEIFRNQFHDFYPAYFIFFEILERFKPLFQIVKIRIGRDIYPIPVPISLERRYKLALRYFYYYVRDAEFERTFELKIGNQLRSIFFSERLIVPQLEAMKRDGVPNRVFSHYRWK